MAMKEEILRYFRYDRSYDGGVSLYMKYGNKIGLKKQFNVQPESEHLQNVLFEELRALAEIDPSVFRVLVSVPVAKMEEKTSHPQVKPAAKAPAKPKKKNQAKASEAKTVKKAKQPSSQKKKAPGETTGND